LRVSLYAHHLQRRRAPAMALHLEAIHAHLSVLSASNHAVVAQPHARHRSSMARDGALAAAGTCVPDLNHAVLCARDEAERVCGGGPDAFDVAEEGLETLAGGHVPDLHGRVE